MSKMSGQQGAEHQGEHFSAVQARHIYSAKMSVACWSVHRQKPMHRCGMGNMIEAFLKGSQEPGEHSHEGTEWRE
jgi:hypothetical protein